VGIVLHSGAIADRTPGMGAFSATFGAPWRVVMFSARRFEIDAVAGVFKTED
jgi:hypothetical protein